MYNLQLKDNNKILRIARTCFRVKDVYINFIFVKVMT